MGIVSRTTTDVDIIAFSSWKAGLPDGLATRVTWRDYAALRVGIVSRYDLIFFKLFAAVDSKGTSSGHYKDLLALQPSSRELAEAAAWVGTQDASPSFATVLEMVVTHLGQNLAHG